MKTWKITCNVIIFGHDSVNKREKRTVVVEADDKHEALRKAVYRVEKQLSTMLQSFVEVREIKTFWMKSLAKLIYR